MEKEMKNIPQKIFLVVDPDDEGPENFNDLSEVLWSSTRENKTDLEYTLSPPAEAPLQGVSEEEIRDFLWEFDYSDSNSITLAIPDFAKALIESFDIKRKSR